MSIDEYLMEYLQCPGGSLPRVKLREVKQGRGGVWHRGVAAAAAAAEAAHTTQQQF